MLCGKAQCRARQPTTTTAAHSRCVTGAQQHRSIPSMLAHKMRSTSLYCLNAKLSRQHNVTLTFTCTHGLHCTTPHRTAHRTAPHRTTPRTAPQNVQGPAADRLLERSIRRYEDEIKPIDADHHGRHSWLPGFLQGGGRTHNRTSSYGEAMPAPGAEGVKTPRKPSPMLPKKSAAKVEKVRGIKHSMSYAYVPPRPLQRACATACVKSLRLGCSESPRTLRFLLLLPEAPIRTRPLDHNATAFLDTPTLICTLRPGSQAVCERQSERARRSSNEVWSQLAPSGFRHCRSTRASQRPPCCARSAQ
jgi:hypothetical protein